MEKAWFRSGMKFLFGDVTDQVEFLPPFIYQLNYNEMFHRFELDLVAEKFSFPYRVYGLEEDFIQRIITTYRETGQNIGMILNGLKGTGKTVLAQRIANELKLPVLIVTEHNPALPLFLNMLTQDVIIFIDEYEKIWDEYDNSILPIMDGVLNSQFRKIFILTTNELRVSQSLMQRPGRVRYIKMFDDLDPKVVEQMVDDMLIHRQYRDDIIKFIAQLENITIDNIKAIITEVNIHNEGPESFKNVLNVKQKTKTYDIYEVSEEEGRGMKMVAARSIVISPDQLPINRSAVGSSLKTHNYNYGKIIKVTDLGYVTCLRVTHEEDEDGDPTGKTKETVATYRLYPVDSYHYQYSNLYE